MQISHSGLCQISFCFDPLGYIAIEIITIIQLSNTNNRNWIIYNTIRDYPQL